MVNGISGSLSVLLLLSTPAFALRGVDPSVQHLYKPDADGLFTCLGDKSIKIPFEQVNDDYCDCPDGSDEPGTAACPGNLFYCQNNGHIPGFIKASMVDDGVCDYEFCCDGSDESQEGLCPDRCAEIHAAYVEKTEREAKNLKEGQEARAVYAKEALAAKQNVEKLLAEARDAVENKREVLRGLENQLEKAIEQGNVVGDNIGEVKDKFIELSQDYAKVVARAQELTKLHSDIAEMMESMKIDYNPNFNDPAVKQAIKRWDELNAEGGPVSNQVQVNPPEAYAEALQKAQEITPEAISHLTAGGSGGRGSSSPFYHSILEAGAARELDGYIAKGKEWLVDKGVLPRSVLESGSQNAGSSSKAVESARAQVADAKKELEDLENSVKNYEEELTPGKYGEDDAFRALKDTCVQRVVGEYEYQYCYYKEARQNSNNGHSPRLGKFDHMEFTDDGKLRLYYENGDRCWNGPLRRATVELSCGPLHTIEEVSEPEKCEYLITGSAPIACPPAEPVHAPAKAAKDEL